MKIPDQGILFEESNEFLAWGESINTVTKRLIIQGEDHGDRTIYQWGKRTILYGLEVELTTMFWNSVLDLWSRKLNEINSWTIGDRSAKPEFERISKHLVSVFGEPTTSETPALPDDQVLKWEFDHAIISLVLFEQHCYKLVLTIEKRK